MLIRNYLNASERWRFTLVLLGIVRLATRSQPSSVAPATARPIATFYHDSVDRGDCYAHILLSQQIDKVGVVRRVSSECRTIP